MIQAPIVMLCLALPIQAAFAAEGASDVPVRGLHVMGPYNRSDLPLCERFIREVLPKAGVNTLVMELDYSFQFRSHPELAEQGALDRDDVRRLAKACRDAGVKLIPQLNCLGHQSWAKNTGALLRVYPQFDETPNLPADNHGIYCRSWCPLAPGLHEVVFDLLDELADACESDAVHCGMDEVFIIADPNCPRCHGKDPAELFAGEVALLHDHLKSKGRTMWMWGDRFLDGKTTGIGKWEASEVGTWPAVDKVPKDIVICDWHYDKAWPTPEFFVNKGFRVLASPWRKSDVALAQLQMIREAHGFGMLQTTWVNFPEFARAYFGGDPTRPALPAQPPNKQALECAACFRALSAAWAPKPPTAQTVFWHEAEIGVQAPDSIGPPTAPRDPASGGAFLKGGDSMSRKGLSVSYELDLPQAIAGAQMIFRYARLHWRNTMVPARISVEITAGADTLKGEAEFPNSGGWGYKPSEWNLAAVKLGSLKAGKCSLKLTGLHGDNDVLMDGFFIAPESFKITAAELALTAIAITSDGYVGLQSPTTVNQTLEPTLRVAARTFSEEPQVTLAIGKTADSAISLKPAGTDPGVDGAILAKFELPPNLDDGSYVVVATGQRPQCRIVVPVVLAGQFLGSREKNIQSFQAFTAELTKSMKPDDIRCCADFQHLVAYLKANGELLSNVASTPVDLYMQGQAAHESVADPASLLDDMRRAVAQGAETMRRLQAGRDPYAGRVGDLRRAYRSAASGELCIYRVFVPSGYEKADKVPFILMLHGGGQDENYFPTLDGGKLLKLLDSRGYLMASPKYIGSSPSFVADMLQLVELMRKEFPKLDPSRTFCTGLSMGGFGTYTLATTHPELFAAICCVSGTGNPALAVKLRTVPTLIFQGGTDEVVPPAGARRVEARMKELGENVQLHFFPIYGHDYHGEEYLKLTLDFFDQYSKQAN